jgi:hypothetical protein
MMVRLAAAGALIVLLTVCSSVAAVGHPTTQTTHAASSAAACPQYTTCPPLTSAERKIAASAAAALQKANAVSSAAGSPTPDTELTVCAHFDKLVLPGIAATLFKAVGTGTPNPPYSKAEATLLRDDSELSHWSYLVLQAGDATFANYLGDAAAALGVVGAPASTDAQAKTAARDMGTVNGYCKYDAS